MSVHGQGMRTPEARARRERARGHVRGQLRGQALGAWAVFAFAGGAVTVALAGGCGTDAVGTEACRQIEQARCERAPSCGIALDVPAHSGDGVEACTRYYRDACRHGLVAADPGQPKTDACVAAIAAGTCDVVTSPQLAPECAFLVPPVPDAGTDAGDAGDAATSASASDAGAIDTGASADGATAASGVDASREADAMAAVIDAETHDS